MPAAGVPHRPPPPLCIPSSTWVLLDPDVATSDSATATAAAASTTSGGRPVRVSLRLTPPPEASLVLFLTDEEFCRGWPMVIAADGDLLLLHATAFSTDGDCPYVSNYFVYSAHPARPSLRRLPCPPEYWLCHLREIAIARIRGDDDGEGFVVVAAIHPTSRWSVDENGGKLRTEVGNLVRYSSTTEEWESMELSIPHHPENGLLPEFVWETDKVFTSGDGEHMCWVDYHRGILFCDVLAGEPELVFVRLPGIETWQDVSHGFSNGRQGRQWPREYRNVDVSEGIVRFVDVDNGLCGKAKTCGFTITTWTLRMPEFEWEKVGEYQFDDLWLSNGFRKSPLPRCAPKFPALSKKDINVIHLVLNEGRYRGKSWMIMLDLAKMTLSSYIPYSSTPEFAAMISGWGADGDDAVDAASISVSKPFISCEISTV